MSDLLNDTDDETRAALASVAYGIAEKLFPRKGSFTSRAVFRAALLRECMAYVESDGLGFVPDEPQALQVLFEVMREALEPSFAGHLPDVLKPDHH